MPPRSGPLTRSVSAALKDAQFLTRDGAAVALVRRYAELIDAAEALADELDGVKAEDEGQAQVLARLKAKVDAQTVTADLGPKFLAALNALGMTPSGRAATTKGGTPSAGTPGSDALAALRAARAASPRA